MNRLTALSPYHALGVCFFVLLWLSIFLTWQTPSPDRRSEHTSTVSSKPQQEPLTVVVASQRQDNTSWLHAAFPTWSHQIYVTDDPVASPRVPANKGREAMVYLTYIIDNYDSLPSVMIFQHANRYQWHNDDPLYDGVRMLNRLKTSHVREAGYVNLRCVWTLGCAVEIRPHVEEAQKPSAAELGDGDPRAGWYYKEAFRSLFPGEPIPPEVGAPCCAQFAAADWKVRQRPRSDYVRYRQWLLDTDLSDHVSGRILEYTWHIIFGGNPVSCPNAQQCYCSLYGLCDLVCEDEGSCGSQYKLPKYSNMPEGWPDFGWHGEWQNATEM